MTTSALMIPFEHTSDATFRAWGLAISNQMTAIGFLKSADTGQIDWATVTRPAINTMAGYEIRYLNDSLHGTNPIYVKIEYGSNNPITLPELYLTVASATNGAGAVSGTTYRSRVAMGYTAGMIAGTYPSFMCMTEGFVGITFMRRAMAGNYSNFFAILRTVDTAGVPTGEGVITYTSSTGATIRVCYLEGTLYAQASNFCIVPGAISTNILPGGNIQVFRHFFAAPDVRCSPQLVSLGNYKEIPAETTFVTSVIAGFPRTYLALSDGGGPHTAAIGSYSTSYTYLGMLWE